LNSDKLEDSKSKYTEALAVMDEKYPKDQIKKIDQKIDEQKDAAAKAEADKLKQEKYNKLITDADNLFSSKDYSDSKSKYQAALDVKSGEAHPTKRIAEIEKILKEIQDKENSALAEKEKQAKYDKLIKEGDDF